MKFGLSLVGLHPRHWVEIAQLAEQHGFESVWAPEHLVLPARNESRYPYTVDGTPPVPLASTPLYDPWILMAGVATATQEIRLATAVYVLPLRHPIAVARTLVTLDVLSSGRVTLGAGVGWLKEEFDAVGLSFDDRGARMDEMIQVMRALWSDEVVEHHGRCFDFDPVSFEPKPVQSGGIPIEIGGSSRPALRRAALLGDGWIEVGSSDLASFTAMVETIRKIQSEAGRSGDGFTVTSKLPRTIDEIERFAAAGLTRVRTGPRITPGRGSVTAFREHVQRYGDEVIARCP